MFSIEKQEQQSCIATKAVKGLWFKLSPNLLLILSFDFFPLSLLRTYTLPCLKWAIPGLVSLFLSFLLQVTINKCSIQKFANDWIWTADLWPLYQLSHCPTSSLVEVSFFPLCLSVCSFSLSFYSVILFNFDILLRGLQFWETTATYWAAANESHLGKWPNVSP